MRIGAFIFLSLLPIASMAQSEMSSNTFTRLELCEIGGYFDALDRSLLEDLARAQISISFPESGLEFFSGPCVTAKEHGYGVGQKASRNAVDYDQAEFETLNNATLFHSQILTSILEQAGLKVTE
ncbi:hypothetical protein [Marinobacter maritimus]|uniref:hypothetical protein n=1 Tax=Marinobacter maritimus TaxID=277961 RepID=UPI0011A4A15F|nr:hypothetical protein [Marinobacter maritimus]